MELFVDIQKKLPGFTLEVAFNTQNNPLGFLGASGSGKSMTLRCIAGLETPTKGRIVLNGQVLFDSDKKINLPSRKRKIGFLFQNYALFPHMTVSENIGFSLKGLSKEQKSYKVQEKISMMHLDGLENRYPYELSGGQQQRVALARALAVEPEALLLDEPFSALDNHLRSQMEKQIIETLSTYQGVTLFVTHNINEVYRVCKDIVVFSEGKIAAQGKKDEVFCNPPTYAAAQLTGCKNISKAKRISEYDLEAVDWGCFLRTKEPISNALTHVGIRAHYLSLSKESQQQNTFKCWVTHTIETPFRVMVYLSVAEGMESSLQWDISKEKWDELKDQPQPWNIHIDSEKFFLINENEDLK